MEENRDIANKERTNSIIHLQDEFEPKEDLDYTPVKQPSFDLNSLKKEMNERYSNQVEREQQIEEILLNSSDENKEEVIPRALLVETQPDSVSPHEELEDSKFSIFCCCRRLCKFFKY